MPIVCPNLCVWDIQCWLLITSKFHLPAAALLLKRFIICFSLLVISYLMIIIHFLFFK